MRADILSVLKQATGEADLDLAFQPKDEFGHYTTAAAMRLGKARQENPLAVAADLKQKIEASAAGIFSKIEVAGPGFLNLWLADEAVREGFLKISGMPEAYPKDLLAGQKVMIEYTNPNPFKQFHIGHLMTNTIGESLARIYEAAGAEVLRVNYQGDVGLHVGMSVWGMLQSSAEMPSDATPIPQKITFLGRCYAKGATAAKGNPAIKTEIAQINKKIYERSDPEINDLYDRGRQWSLDYFETLYARLGTKFVHYFFESEVGPDGLKIVKAHPEVFRESEGAIIFPGEEYGLHNRVFVNSLGLPTYEAKELGLNQKKFELYHPDLSIVSTANEINEYFRVLMKAMELTIPEVAKATRHSGHGMLRLPSGKMSSRTGEVITAEELIDKVKEAVEEKLREREGLSPEDRELIKEKVSLAAIRYAILRQGIGKDIVFDMETSISFSGDSGPYLQYTYARLRKLIAKGGNQGKETKGDPAPLQTEHELRLMRKMFEFPEEVRRSIKELSANNLATYLYEFANLANRFYEDEPILADENEERRAARLLLSDTAARILRQGLHLLCIEVLETI